MQGVTLDVKWEYYDGTTWQDLDDNSNAFANLAMTDDHGICYIRNAAGTPTPVDPEGDYVLGVIVRATVLAKTSGEDTDLSGVNGAYRVTVNKTSNSSRLKLINETTVPTPEASNGTGNPFENVAITWDMTISGGAFSSNSNQKTFVVAVSGEDGGTADTGAINDTLYLSVALAPQQGN